MSKIFSFHFCGYDERLMQLHSVEDVNFLTELVPAVIFDFVSSVLNDMLCVFVVCVSTV